MLKKYSLIFVVLSIFIAFGYIVYHSMIESIVKNSFHQAQLNIKNEISNKLKDTLAISITLSKNQNLKKVFFGKQDSLEDIKTLPKLYRKYTKYKNIWIEIVDKNGNILYRSWVSEKGGNVKNYYEEMNKWLKNPKIFSAIFINRYAFAFHSFSPIYNKDRFLGYVIIISHFNSITKNLEKYGFKSLVVADKSYKNSIKYPYTKDFIDGYYVANFNPDKNFVQIVKDIGIENIIKSSNYIRYKDCFLTKFKIKNYGWFIIGKSFEDLKQSFYDNSFLWYLGVLFVLVALFIIFLIYINNIESERALKRQIKYYYNTLNSLQEIVIITDGEHLKFANKRFFDYFDDYKNLDDFLKEHSCICDFFAKDKGFLMPLVNGKRWTKYLIEESDRTGKVKIVYKDKIYIFLVKAANISEKEYSIIFSDITQEYMREMRLKEISQKDELTKLYNRRAFEILYDNSFKEAKEKNYNLWLAILDIDHFKEINDTYGHMVGDKVLKEIADIIKKTLREGDEVFRIGGEEFAIIFKNISGSAVKRVLERVRENVKAKRFPFMNRSVTISIGAARLKKGDSKRDLFERADELLYEAKRRGRDRVISA